MKLFAVVAATAGSLAFQMSIDAGYIKDYAWLIPWFWGLSAALWCAWALTHDTFAKCWFKELHNKLGRGVHPIRVFICLCVFLGVSLGVKALIKAKNERTPVAPQITQSQQTPVQPPATIPQGEKAQRKKQIPKEAPGVSTSGSDSPAVGSITQGAGSIAQVGGTGNQATVNNFEPLPPHVNWSHEMVEPNSNPMKPYQGWSIGGADEGSRKDHEMRAQFVKNPGVLVTLSPESAWGEFGATCDRPCESINAQFLSSGGSAIGQTSHQGMQNTRITAIQCANPSAIPSGGIVKWEIRSLDEKPLNVTDVQAIHLKFSD